MTSPSGEADGEQFAHFKRTFFDECGDLLASADTQLTRLGNDPADLEAIAALFRAVHSIKGGAGVFGFERLVAFAHVLETRLDEVRQEPSLLTGEAGRSLHGLLTAAVDVLSDLVAAAQGGTAAPEGMEDMIARALGASAPPAPSAPTRQKKIRQAVLAGASTGRWRIDFAPAAGLLRNANEPLLLIRALTRFAQIETTADMSRIPYLEDLQPEECYLSWRIDAETTAERQEILEVFEFVLDDCVLNIAPIRTMAPAQQVTSLGAQSSPGAAEAAIVPGVAPAVAGSRSGDAAAGSIRVDLEKVDRLVNMVGEIVITQAMLHQQVETLQIARHPTLGQGLEQMAQHIRELQDSVMSIRAQPVRSVFARMPRLARELAAELRKEVRIATAGETTEVDKTVIEQLSDPLTHMVRNAIDHGIEMPDVRAAAGKPRQGTITLSAAHRAGRIAIEIADDGAGLDADRIRQKCVERGLIAPDAVLSDEDAVGYIFMPGFSTASRISNISGRGVGMDVVNRNIQALGGRIEVVSRRGQGSRFTILLPLTLAVLDGMVVTVGDERYIIPLTAIVESLRPRRGDISRLAGGGEVLSVRGDYVPIIRLRDAFSVPQSDRVGGGLVVLVEVDGDRKSGLFVDEILGQQQVVIKSLEANYQRIRGVSAATILGDGRVALILDVAGLAQTQQSPPPQIADTLAMAS